MKSSPWRHPAALLPLLMSLAALSMIGVYVALFGVVRHEDEGTPARVFQLLMVAQLPVMAWFAGAWLPRAPREALKVLALQACAWIVPVVTILVLEM